LAGGIALVRSSPRTAFDMISKSIAILLTLFLIAGVPILSQTSAQPEKLRQVPRTALYFSAAFSEWILALAGVIAVLAGPAGFASFGFRGISGAAFAKWTLILAATTIAGLGVVIFFERLAWLPDETEIVYLLMPATRREKLWALFVVAPTAGLCEEFLYRGFLLAQLSAWMHSALWALAISSVIFGFAHVYQGPSGIIRAALLGALLALPVVRTGSLYPGMLAHATIDAVALLWLGPRFLKQHHEFAGGSSCDGT
jgi:CAAX protease family protein